MRKYSGILFLCIAVFCAFFLYIWMRGNALSDEKTLSDTQNTDVVPEVVYIIMQHVVAEDDTFADVVLELGISYNEMLGILDAASSTFDFTRIKIGQPLRVAKDDKGRTAYLEYEPNKDEIIKVSFISSGYSVEKSEIPYTIEIVTQHAEVMTSLYIDALSAGIPEEVVMQFADIFAWTVDFAVQVQEHDEFEVVYEKRYREGVEAGTGRVLAGTFTNVGTQYDAYLFKDIENNPAYFSGTGEAMQKQFLKAPLNYRRISSGYTYGRFHPVLQQAYDHLAIDYAAAVGTPVMAVGDGVITYAGWNGGFGNYIDIRHNEMYQTQYAHLSGYTKGIKVGTQVTQGQVIGYVGSTGWSTGPHLHYQIKYYGKLVNPLEVELPPGDPVSTELFQEFEQAKQEYDRKLQGL